MSSVLQALKKEEAKFLKERNAAQQQLDTIHAAMKLWTGKSATGKTGRKRRRKMSAETRKKMAASARKRWAAAKETK